VTETNTLASALNTVFESLISDVHTALPGRIEKYEFATQKAQVKPLIKRKYLDGEVLDLPVLVNVPVVFPRTKKSGITFPLSKGDGVLVIFTERALERWKSSGGDSEPGDRRKFDLSDGIAIPGCFSFKDANLASNNEDLEIHHNGFKIVIKKDGKIQVLGSGGVDLVKVLDDWMTQMQATTTVVTGAAGVISPASIGLMQVIQLELKKLLVV
jgi:hypothetical protein